MVVEDDKSPSKTSENNNNNDDNENEDSNRKKEKANVRKRTKTGCLSMFHVLNPSSDPRPPSVSFPPGPLPHVHTWSRRLT